MQRTKVICYKTTFQVYTRACVCVRVHTRGGGQQRGSWYREVGCGCSSIGAKSQWCADWGSRGMECAVAADASDCAAHAVHVRHVGQVTDAAAATVAAVVGRVEG